MAGKVVSMIVDGESTNNFVSQAVIEKLQLKTNKHPRPYYIQRLAKEDEIQMQHQCLVSFLI